MKNHDFDSLVKLIKMRPPIDDVELAECAQLLAYSFPKNGVHQWLPKVAYAMQHNPMMMDPIDVYKFLRRATRKVREDREVPDDEIANAINLTRLIRLSPSNGKERYSDSSRTTEKAWKRMPTARAKIVAQSSDDLRRVYQMSPNLVRTREVAFAAMYPSEDIRLAWIYDKHKTGAMLAHWNSPRLHKRGYPQWYIPNPVIARWGTTKKGNSSERALDNIGPRWYLVIEFDQGTKDDNAKVIFHLRDDYFRMCIDASLVMIIDSGGKSLHSFWFVKDISEDDVRRMCKRAYALGACSSTLQNKGQMVRVPDAIRDNGNIQQIYYLNTKAIKL